MKFILSILLLLGSCTLAENIKEEEGKDYCSSYSPDPVEYYDSATLQRLEDFYWTDSIDYNYLRAIYKGNLDLRSAESVKLHWEKARGLALTEWEFQKEERGWTGFGLSTRPRMVIDDKNTKFYRYYEFLVLDNDVIKGSILIPMYKKTENFFTTEVRVYYRDQITFESFPTKWGEFAASQFPEIKIEKGSNVDLMFDEIYDDILRYNEITEYDIYYKQISEELTNKNLLPVQGVSKTEISNRIKQETQIKFSNNIATNYFQGWKTVMSNVGGGGCGTGVGCGGNTAYPVIVITSKENKEREERSKKVFALKEEEILVREQEKYYQAIENDINANIARQMTDENFEKTRQIRRKDFLDQTKVAYEKSVYIWNTNFLIEMGYNEAQQEIADGYSILFWDELERENRARIAAIGVGALTGGIGNIAFQLSSGVSLEDIDFQQVFSQALLGGAIGGLLPAASVVGTTIIASTLVKELVITVSAAIVGGTVKGTTDLPFIGEVINNYMLMFTGANGAITAVVSDLMLVVEEVSKQYKQQKITKHLSEQIIENPSGIVEKAEMPPSTPGGGSASGGANDSGPGGPNWNGGNSSGGSNGNGGNSSGGSTTGNCTNSNHSDSNSGGHNYGRNIDDLCIYEEL
ncbi:MAG: hypothetical protein ACRC0X_08655 [Brevinema sp.]